jgi:hypothetical protein
VLLLTTFADEELLRRATRAAANGTIQLGLHLG